MMTMMTMPLLAAIEFPPLDPILFRIGPLAVRWYGVAYLLGFALAYGVLWWMVRRQHLRISLDQLSSLLSWLVVGVIVGGRAGWWLFYHRDMGQAEAWYEPLAIWRGGMSFHGGLLGVAVVLLLWARRQKVSLWQLADAAALVAPIGLFLGRIANFVNAELVGRPTSLPWGVIFPGESFARHPSQLYEALLEGPLLAAALWTVWRVARWRPGRIAALFLALYGALRFLVEFARQPDEQLGFVAFGWMTMGQLLSAGLAIVAIVAAAAWHFAGKGRPTATNLPVAAGPASFEPPSGAPATPAARRLARFHRNPAAR